MKAVIVMGMSFAIAIGIVTRTFADDNAVASDAKSARPLRAGAVMPDVSVTNSKGDRVTLASLHRDGPVVLVFFRGGWCPVCTRHTQALIKSHPQVKELGAQLVAISPDDATHSQANVTKNSIPFPILSDPDVVAAKAFGLAFKVDDATFKQYQGFGVDLEQASGRKHHALPVPAVFIVDKSGKIVFAHSNPDYRERLDTARIIAELKGLK